MDDTAQAGVVNPRVPPLPNPADRSRPVIEDYGIPARRSSARERRGNQASGAVKPLDRQPAQGINDAQVAQFVACVFEPDDIVELRLLPSTKSTWHKAADLAGELARLNIANGNGQNIYAGANPRTHDGGTKATDVLLARCLFADIDHTTNADEVRSRWQAAGLPEPTLLVDSGHGIHAWWRLNEPLTDMAEWTSLQKALIRLLGSDKAIHDAPRIMRVPGFQNCKADPRVACRIISAVAARRSHQDEFRILLTGRPKAVRPESNTEVCEVYGIADRGSSDRDCGSQPLCNRRDERGAQTEGAATICLAAMRRMNMADQKDGSHRLYAAACRAVEHNLDDSAALSIVRAYAIERPFPREWTDQEILQRLRDAEKKCTRGQAFRDDQRPPAGREHDDRPEILITTEEHLVNDAALDALSRDKELYHRCGVLVHVVRGGKRVGGVNRPADCPRIAVLPAPVLRERLTKAGRFVITVETKNGETETVNAHPPQWCTKAIHARGVYPSVRPLEGIVEAPILRPDGTILDTPGYDRQTGLLYLPNDQTPAIAANPSAQEVRTACELLLNLVRDFPFECLAHRSTWLSALLTPLARHAFYGPAPLHLFDANVRGSGKTLLAEINSLIVTGREIPRTPNPRNNEESRKLILALALSGDSLILIDNVAGELGSPALDAALTATLWRDRILGRSQIVTMPLNVTWLASGNNVVLIGDTLRRVVHCRLNCPDEHPEERQGFAYPRLLAHVREHRTEFLGAALTILRAFFAADCPQSCIRSWGSFDAWSDLIRQCIIWLELPDPGETREELRTTADRDGRVLAALLGALHEADPHGQGMTTAQIIAALERLACASLKDAIHELCDTTPAKPPSPRSLGNKLAHLRGRVVGGRALETRPGPAGFATWRVISAAGPNSSSEVGGQLPGGEWGEV